MKERILSCLSPQCTWGDYLHYYPCVDSTNTRAKAMAAAGAPHGTVLVADCQTAGRGRLGRSFLSPAGSGIYLSVILRPGCRPDRLMHLTCAVAVAMCDAVEKAVGLRPGIKWINDLVIGTRKVAGILTELSVDTAGSVGYAVVGIGINCAQRQTDFPPELREIATSLAQETDHPIDRPRLAAAMIEALWQMDRTLLTGRAAAMARYRTDCVTLGREVCVHRSDGVERGTALDVAEDGALLVRFSDGRTEAVNAGEVSVRGMYGYA